MRRLARFRNGADYKPVEVVEGGYPVYGSGGEFKRASEFLFDGESVLFGRKGTIDKPLLVSGRFWTVDTMFFTELYSTIEPRFLHYYATTMPFAYYSTSTALPSMTQGELGSHRMPLPPLDEQRAIADFLDRETARIDTLIEEQQRLIELLRERRTTTIADATGWGPQNYENWSDWRLSWLFDSTASGTTPSNEDIEYSAQAEVPWVTTGELRESVIHGTERGVTHDVLDRYSALRVHPAGSLLIAMYGATIGRMAILGVDAASNQACCALRAPHGTTAEYVQYSLMAAKPRLLLEASGGGQPNINQDKIRSFRIPLPPLQAQKRIVTYLDLQTTRIDTLIAETEKFIDLSRERRSALITAAVTGQIDIRDKAAG